MKTINNIPGNDFSLNNYANSLQRIDPFKTDEGDNDATRIKPEIEEPRQDPEIVPNLPTPPSPQPETQIV